MMRPKSAHYYIKPIQETSREFVEYVRKGLDENKVYSGDILTDLQTWAFESITIIALDYKIGAFKVL